jgi:mycofactocin biosynthetic radical S-adenosylmethionine protein MftC
MRYRHTVGSVATPSDPLVLVPQFFGSLIFDRRSSRYLPFDHESTSVLLELADTPFEEVHRHWPAAHDSASVAALEGFYEGLDALGFFTLDGRLAASVLPVTAPPGHLAGPLAVHLEVAAFCNLTCTHCFAGDLPRREKPLPLAALDALFAEMAAMGSFRLGLTGGEPLLRRDLFDVIDLAASHGLHPCVTTNGLLITEEVARDFGARHLVWLNVSLDGATAATNDRVRGAGTFDRVLDRIAVLRQHARFTLAFTIMKTNLHEIERCVELAAQVGASTAVFRPLYPAGVAKRHLDELMPSFADYSDALSRIAAVSGVGGGFDLRHIDPFSPSFRDDAQAVTHVNLGCGAANLVASVSLGGDVNPCSFLGREHVAGNLRDSSLGEIWNHSAGFTGMRALPGGNPAGGAAFAGGCRARSLVLAGSVNAPDPWLAGHDRPAGSRALLPLLTVEREWTR